MRRLLALATASALVFPAHAQLATSTPYGEGCVKLYTSIYEWFGSSPFDLSGTPGAANGLTFNFTGVGYVVLPGSGPMFTPISLDLVLPDDGNSPAQPLPFTFPLPGTASTNAVFLCSNGYLWLTAAGQADYTPSVAEFLAQGERIAPYWTDLNPSAGGTCHFDVDPNGAAAYATWVGVPHYSSGGANTFQIALFSGGSFEIRWEACNTSTGVLAGWTPAGGALDPGSTDLSALTATVTLPDSPGLSLASTGRPVLGTTMALVTSDIPAGTPLGSLVFSFTRHSPGLSLASMGMETCYQYVGLDASVAFLPTTATVNFNLPVPNNAALAGTHVYVQSATFSGGLTTLGVIASNGLDLGLNTQ